MKTPLFVIVLVLPLFFLPLSCSSEDEQGNGDSLTPEQKSCTLDTDCMALPSCCDCSERAIHKDYYDEYVRENPLDCKDLQCPAVECGEGTPVCPDESCTVDYGFF